VNADGPSTVPYCVRGPASAHGPVEAWSGYPLQFAGQRRFNWQDQMAAELRAALVRLTVAARDVLAGDYLSTDSAPCDAENRLFTNPGTSSFPSGVTSIRFERGVGPPPAPPEPVARVDGQIYYCRYRVGGTWQWWEPDALLARWDRVTRHLADDGSARPAWLAMKQAAEARQIETFGGALDNDAPFGIRITVHATPQGPRQATAISEPLIDGTIAAFHAGASAPTATAAAAALAPRMPGTEAASIQALATMSSPGPIFPGSPFLVKGSYVQISPCDERCNAGQVTIQPDAHGPSPQISGELFTLRRARPQTDA
jgi:hypothetical protein